MEEESFTRRRNIKPNVEPIFDKNPLHEQIVILIGTRNYFKMIVDPISLSFRCLILADLILDDLISLNSSKKVILVKQTTNDPLLLKTANFIGKEMLTLKEWLEILNGENYNPKFKYQIKNTRNIIYKKLEEKSKIKFRNNYHNKVVEITDQKYRNNLVINLTAYLMKKEVDLAYDVLVCALFYCKAINQIFISLSPQQQSMCRFRVEDILMKYRNYYKREDLKEEMIALLLKAFLKKF